MEWLKGSYSTGSLFTVEEPQFPQGVGVIITVKKGGSEAEIGGRETGKNVQLIFNTYHSSNEINV